MTLKIVNEAGQNYQLTKLSKGLKSMNHKTLVGLKVIHVY